MMQRIFFQIAMVRLLIDSIRLNWSIEKIFEKVTGNCVYLLVVVKYLKGKRIYEKARISCQTFNI